MAVSEKTHLKELGERVRWYTDHFSIPLPTLTFWSGIRQVPMVLVCLPNSHRRLDQSWLDALGKMEKVQVFFGGHVRYDDH